MGEKGETENNECCRYVSRKSCTGGWRAGWERRVEWVEVPRHEEDRKVRVIQKQR